MVGDTLESVYNEISPLEKAIFDTGENIRTLAKNAANARANYELEKNKTLIKLYQDEAKEKTKRTEAQRTAIYRHDHHQLRLDANLAENEWKAERDYLDALKSKLMAIQTRAGLLKTEHSISRYTA